MILEVPSLVWVFAFAVVVELICIRLRFPSVIGLLLTGMIIGPHVLNLVSSEDISVFAEIGAILLLFSIGIEFSLENLIKMGLRPVLTGLTKVLLVFFLTQNILTLLGFDLLTSLIIAMAISSSSTSLIVRILQQRNLFHKSESKFVLTEQILEDLIAIFYLAIISTLTTNHSLKEFNFVLFFSNFAFSITIIILLYIVLKRVLIWLSRPIINYGSEGTLIFSTILVAMLMSSIAKAVNLSSAIGAFLAGSMIVSLPRHEVFKNAIKPFDITFSSMFFISIGMLINPNVFINQPITLITLSFLSIGIVYLSSFLGVYLFGMPKNGSAALLIASLIAVFGEFTLLIAQQAQKLSSFDFIGFASSLVFFSAILNPFLVDNSAVIRKIIKLIIRPELIRQFDLFVTYINLPIQELLKHYNKLTKFDLSSVKNINSTDSLRIYLMIAYLIAFLIINKSDLPYNIKVDILILLFLLIIPVIIKSFLDFGNLLIKNFNNYICNCQRIVYNISRNQIALTLLEGLTLLLITFMIPIIFQILGLSRISIFFYAPLFFIALIFFIRTIKKLNETRNKKSNY